jgi:N-glycosylase/DNA lyase
MIKTEVSLFDPDRICDSGQIFRMYRAEDRASVFLLYSGDRRLVITGEGKDVFFHCGDDEYESYWKHFLDMDRDYGRFASKLDPRDDFLKRAYDAGKGLRILNQDLFETIISFIVSQQKQIPSIRKCVEALCERFGKWHEVNDKSKDQRSECYMGEGWYGFPDPRSIAAAGPGALKGLSLGYRERYIYESSCRFIMIERELRESIEKKDFPNVKRLLLSMTGIGAKVADCIMLFACGDLDSFPVDTHIISILEREYPSYGKNNTKDGKDTHGEMGKKIQAINEKSVDSTKVEKLTPVQARERAREVFGRYKGFSGLVQQWIFAYEIMKK